MKCKNNAGFSLVEMLVAIVILGLITIPMTSGMVASMKILARSEEMMDAQMAVSSAVEVLMAEGIASASDAYKADEFEDVVIKTVAHSEGLPCYEVTVTSKDESVSVTTVIRKAGGG